MKVLIYGADWIAKYLIAHILLEDQEQEAEVIVIDRTQTAQEFFTFPQLGKYGGDERLLFGHTLAGTHSNIDVVIINSNILSEVEEAMKNLGNFKGKIIVLSSWQVYGYQGRRQIPFDEETTDLMPTTQEGQTKLAIERIVTSYKYNIVIFRLSTIFGPYMPEGEILDWIRAILINEPIRIAQPAGRYYDLCYFLNIMEPIRKAMDLDLVGNQTPMIINLGSADIDYKTVREKGKDVEKVQIFEKNIVEYLVGTRVLLDSYSQIYISEEGISEVQGRGFHCQLKTERARKALDYFPLVDTLKGTLQTAFWLRNAMEKDDRYMEKLGRAIEDIYPTLDDKQVYKVGENTKSKEVVYAERKDVEKEIKEKRDAGTELLCLLCNHLPTTVNPSKTNPDDLDEECKCGCHALYRELKFD